jgi:hypothetical protein
MGQFLASMASNVAGAAGNQNVAAHRAEPTTLSVAPWLKMWLIRADARGFRPLGETLIQILPLTPGTAKNVASQLKLSSQLRPNAHAEDAIQDSRNCASQYGDSKALICHQKVRRPS